MTRAEETPAQALRRSASSTAIGRKLLWGAADQAVFSAMSFVLAIAVAQHATAAEFGAFGIAYVVYTLLLGTVEAFTAEVVAVRGSKLAAGDLHWMLRDASGTAIAAGLCCTVVGVLLTLLGPSASTASALLIPAPLLFAQDVWRFGFFTSGRPTAALGNDLLWAALLAAGLALSPSLGSDRATALVWVWSGSGALCGVVGAIQARCLPRVTSAARWTRAYDRAGARYAGEFLALYGAAQGVLISVGLFSGLAESGGYRGAQLLFGPVQVLLNAMRIAVTPLFAQAQARGQARVLWRRGLTAGAIGAIVTLACGVASVALPQRIGEKILGRSWILVHEVLPPMLWAQTALALGLGALVILRAAEALRRTFKVRVVGAVIIFGLGTAGAWIGGAVAATAGVAVGASLTTMALWWEARLVSDRPGGDHHRQPNMRRPQRGLRLREVVPGRDRRVADLASASEWAKESPPTDLDEMSPLPDIFVIGAMRAGTTSFCADLGTHPGIVLSHLKEPWILVRSLGRVDVARSMYRSLYGNVERAGHLLLDGSTSYSMRPEQPSVAPLALQLSPHAKVLYMVRNPVHRALSHHRHLLAWGATDYPDFGAAVRYDKTLVDYGRYWWQLQPWLDAYGPESVTVVLFEEYSARRGPAVADVVASLGLDPRLLAIDETTILNQSAGASAVPRWWRSLLLSDLYQFQIRRRIPERSRNRLGDLMLPKAPRVSVPPPSYAIERIIDACHEDAEALASFLGRDEPLWDWEATLREFV